MKKEINVKKAVALKYNQNKDKAPKVIAKGKGEIAKKIVEIAREKKIPLYEDKGLTEVLEALDLNMEIPQSLYKAIAEVLVFIYKLDKKK
jgi:flagellar biosynthesis protein